MSNDQYEYGDPLPPVGTRVVHALHGPAVIDRDREEFEQWYIRFDTPFPGDGGRTVDAAWVYPHNLRRPT